MAETPQGCVEHQPKYKAQAWEAYSLLELGAWVHLLTKRAEHRSDAAKRAKDLHDAQNYLDMMQAKLNEVRGQDPHEDEKRALHQLANEKHRHNVDVQRKAAGLDPKIRS